MSTYSNFADISWRPIYVILQRFYGVPTMSIYRDFMVSGLCQFTEILHEKTNPAKSRSNLVMGSRGLTIQDLLPLVTSQNIPPLEECGKGRNVAALIKCLHEMLSAHGRLQAFIFIYVQHAINKIKNFQI